MGNTNSIDVSRRITNGRTNPLGSITAEMHARPFDAADWEDTMMDAMASGVVNANALDYNTRLFRELARQGEALGFGKDV